MYKTICNICTLFSCLVFFLVFSCFLTAASAADITLAWDPNTESDLTGYRVYYKTGSSGTPYDGAGAVQGSSGITIPLEALSDSDNPRFTLTGLSEETVYYLAVTAYNTQGSESGYSNEVSHLTASAAPVVTEYTITATSGANGSISPSGATTVVDGASQTYTITPAAGYHVAGVTVDGASVGVETAYTFNNVSASHTISASFEIDTHTITAASGANGSISPSGTTTVADGASQTYTITPAAGYHVAGVTVDGGSIGAVTAYTFNNVTVSHTISASFEIDTHTITATSGANGSISPSGTTTVADGASQTYTITPAAGYHVAGVTVDGGSIGAVTAYTFNNVTASHTISASFEIDTHTITATSGANGSISPSGATTVADGASQTYTITPAAGYHVAGISVDGASAGVVTAYTFNNVSASHTISASFEISTHTITATSGANGSISPSGATTVADGASQTYTITPAAGYHVAGVSVDGALVGVETAYSINPLDGSSSEGASTYTFSNVTIDHTLTAVFEIDIVNYTITAASGANGSISPSGTTTVADGASQTYTITPAAGYHVAGVSVDGGSIGAVTAYTFNNVTVNHMISASFEIDTHTITATSGANGSISPSGTTTVADGASQTYTITPAAGYHVAGVSVDGASAGSVTAYTFNNVSASHTISASFEILTHTITATAGPNGSISPAGELTVQDNGDQAFSITPEADCTIADVLVDGVSVGAVTRYTFSSVTGNHVITASFQMANQLPEADAGPDQTVDEGVMVNLSGTNSFDLDDGIAFFKWEQTGGTSVALSTPDDNECTFLTPDVGQDGETLAFRLTVTDYSGAVSTDDCLMNVTWINEPPTADAGPDVNVNEGETVTLDAGKSVDEDDGIGSYQWVQIEGTPVSLSDSTSALPEFTAPDVGPAGVALKFQLTVADNGGLQAQDTCIVNVCWQNQPPVSDAGVDQTVDGGAVVTLNGTGSTDPDDGISSYRWNQISGTPVTLSDPTAVSSVFTVPAAGTDGEILSFTLTVTDTGGLQHADACMVTVSYQEMDTISPTVLITSPRVRWYYYFTWNRYIDVAGTASDNVGVSRVTWSNSAGGSGTASGTTQWKVTAMALRRGYNVVTLTAEDTAGNQSSRTITIYRIR